MSDWMTHHGWKAGLVLIAVCVIASPANPVVYAACSIGAIVCCWWGLAVHTKRGFVEGYRDDPPGGPEGPRGRD